MTSDINRNITVWLGYKEVAKTGRSLTLTSLEKIVTKFTKLWSTNMDQYIERQTQYSDTSANEWPY